ncbi:sugar phosphate isomerase/epimerase family protein [Foetidibacter luteolus]|uniref:sugar phosphate isomerase/epimerase family protein n=1 Tax=Foetidibacter luteolus TaxID=2608880 RepID=UPI00129BF333|nr:sugar phosphate isomerase/epimerase [Foetidibacter luteolus]
MKKLFIILFISSILFENGNVYAQGKPLYTAPLGVQAYTFRKSFPVDVAKTLDTIKMFGFTELEGGGGRMPPAEFKKLCDERGISIPSSGAGYEQLVNQPDSVAWRAKALGSKYVMCAWIPHKNGVLTFEDARKAVDDFNKAGKYLKEQGLTFCYHAHGYEFQPYGNGTLLDYIFENTNPEYVSFEMDIFWIQFGGGDPVALLKKYGNRWKLMHVKDLRKGAKTDLTGLTGPENDVPLGQGQVDIPGILKEAKKIGIKHYFIEDESTDVNSHVPQSIAYLKSLTE